jgi:hypothetical protein
VVPGVAFSRSRLRNDTPPTAEPHSKHPETPAPNAESIIGRLGDFLASLHDGKWLKIHEFGLAFTSFQR